MRLIIHHWDADGIGSAVLWTRVKGEEFKYFTPEIGNYFLSPEDRKKIGEPGAESLVLLDMSLPEEDLLFLNSLGSFQVVDHHHGKRVEGIDMINPTLEGREAPSNTRVITELFRLPHNHMEYLGIYGDNGFKLKDGDPILEEMKEFYGKDFERFKKAVKIVDLQYKTGDRERVYSVVKYLLSQPLLSVLEREEFTGVEKMVEEEIRREEAKLMEGDVVNFLFTPTRFRIVSDLTRRIFARSPEKINLVVGLQGDYLNFYLRTRCTDLSSLVKRAKDMGFYAGGKRDVIGAVVERGKVEDYVNLLEDFFRSAGKEVDLRPFIGNLL